MKAVPSARDRRVPVPRDRYRAVARQSGIAARLRRRPQLELAVLAAAVLFMVAITPRLSDGFVSGIASIGTSLTQLGSTEQGNRSIDLPSGGGTVTAAPVASGLPDFTNQPALTVNGQIPEFALAAGRTIDVSLNGASVATLTPDASGAFSTALTLRDGSNAIVLALRSGSDTVASSSYIVVLDRQAPTLTVTKPVAGATVDGPNVTVEGKADVGTTVTVNDRTVLSAQDGTFTTTFSASAGAQTITVVGTDRAGNTTKTTIDITVRDAAVASLLVTVVLDPSTVAPGAHTTATVRVTANGVPKAGQLVTLLVGLYTVGSFRTDANGIARIGFAAPPNVGDAVVLALTDGASGRATLTVAK